MKEKCPKCKILSPLTEHHIIPRRIRDNGDTFRLCRECHNQLEIIITGTERRLLRQHEDIYWKALERFLKEK